MTGAREPAVEPAPRHPETSVDPDLVEAARILRGALVRVHPSFRFEERLAARLETAARGSALADPLSRVGRGDVIRFPGHGQVDGQFDEPFPGRHPQQLAGHADGQPAVRMPPRRVLIGGVIASGVSLAGAAYLARRWLTRGA